MVSGCMPEGARNVKGASEQGMLALVAIQVENHILILKASVVQLVSATILFYSLLRRAERLPARRGEKAQKVGAHEGELHSILVGVCHM